MCYINNITFTFILRTKKKILKAYNVAETVQNRQKHSYYKYQVLLLAYIKDMI